MPKLRRSIPLRRQRTYDIPKARTNGLMTSPLHLGLFQFQWLNWILLLLWLYTVRRKSRPCFNKLLSNSIYKIISWVSYKWQCLDYSGANFVIELPETSSTRILQLNLRKCHSHCENWRDQAKLIFYFPHVSHFGDYFLTAGLSW